MTRLAELENLLRPARPSDTRVSLRRRDGERKLVCVCGAEVLVTDEALAEFGDLLAEMEAVHSQCVGRQS